MRDPILDNMPKEQRDKCNQILDKMVRDIRQGNREFIIELMDLLEKDPRVAIVEFIVKKGKAQGMTESGIRQILAEEYQEPSILKKRARPKK
jgi:cell division inhibitor SulA